jgi:hypothetical protein
MAEHKIKALISLLDDPNEDIFIKVKEKIILEGVDTLPDLKRAVIESDNIYFRNKVKKIIKQINVKYIHDELWKWAESKEKDMFFGHFLLAKYRNPALTLDKLNDKINPIINDIRNELNVYLTAIQQIKIINNIFFEKYGFTAIPADSSDQDTFYIDTVLNTKKGNDVTLAVIYQHIALQTGLKLYGVNFTRIFLLGFFDERDNKSIEKENALFYVNPFYKGAIYSVPELVSYYESNKTIISDYMFHAADGVDVLQRNLLLLMNSFPQKFEESKYEAEYIKLLSIILHGSKKNMPLKPK